MDEIDTEQVCFIIAKAREFDVQEGAVEEDPASNPVDDDFQGVLAAGSDNATYRELKAFIEALSEGEQAELVALTWVGRDDYDTTEWPDLVQEAVERHSGPTADYLLGIPLLADYLEAALTAFGRSCDE